MPARPLLAFLGATLLAAVAIAAAPRAAAPSALRAAEPAEFEIDVAHSTLIYRVRHFGVSNFYGRINGPSGSFLLDAERPEASRLSVEIEIKNMDAGNESRDRFLLSPDFFNVREHPKASFVATSIRPTAPGVFEAMGDFTMHGETRPITVRLDGYVEKATDRFGYRAGFECTFEVKRSDYGMDLFVKEGTLGDEVRITVAIEGVRR